MSKACEIAKIGDEQVVIYDVQLARSFRTLTSILIWGGDERHATTYFSKLMAEAGILVGNGNLAKAGFEHFCGNIGFWKPGQAEEISEALKYGSLSSFFMIAHECFHHIMVHDRTFSDVKKHGEVLIEDGRSSDWRRIVYEQHSSNFVNVEAFNSYADGIDNSEKFVSENGLSLSDELTCDMSAFCSLLIWCQGNNVPIWEAYRSAWLSIKHSWLLASLQAFAFELQTGLTPTGVDGRTRLLNARADRMMNSFASMASTLDGSLDADAVSSDVVRLATTYRSNIERPLWSLTIPQFIQMRSGLRARERDVVEDIRYCYSQAERMGWRPFATDMEFFVL